MEDKSDGETEAYLDGGGVEEGVNGRLLRRLLQRSHRVQPPDVLGITHTARERTMRPFCSCLVTLDHNWLHS